MKQIFALLLLLCSLVLVGCDSTDHTTEKMVLVSSRALYEKAETPAEKKAILDNASKVLGKQVFENNLLAQPTLQETEVTITVKADDTRYFSAFLFIVLFLVAFATMWKPLEWVWNKISPLVKKIWVSWVLPLLGKILPFFQKVWAFILKLWSSLVAFIKALPAGFWYSLVFGVGVLFVLAGYQIASTGIGVFFGFLGLVICTVTGVVYLNEQTQVDPHRHEVMLFGVVAGLLFNRLFDSFVFVALTVTCGYLAILFIARKLRAKEKRDDHFYMWTIFWIAVFGFLGSAAVIAMNGGVVQGYYIALYAPAAVAFLMTGVFMISLNEEMVKTELSWVLRQVLVLVVLGIAYAVHPAYVGRQGVAMIIVAFLVTKIKDFRDVYPDKFAYLLFSISAVGLPIAWHFYFHPENVKKVFMALRLPY